MMKINRIISIILVFALISSFAPSALALEISVSALEDTLVRSGGKADVNYGGTDVLWVSNTATSYLKFDVSSLKASMDGKDDVSYILSLTTCANESGAGDVYVYGISGDNRTGWSEDTLTYNMTHQRVGNGMDSDVSNLLGSMSVSGFNATFTLDVTEYVNSVPSDGIATLKLQNTAQVDLIRFHSSESKSEDMRPVLTAVSVDEETILVQKAVDSIDIESIVGDISAVENDFILPLESDDGTVSFTWESGDSDALKIYGENAVVVSNPAEREVDLTVIASNGEDSAEKTFTLNILPAVYTGEYMINEDFEDVEEGYLPEDGKWGRDKSYTEEQVNIVENGELMSFMGVTERDGSNVLRVYKKEGFGLGGKPIHSVYASFGEIEKDSQLVVTYNMMLENITNDAMGPRFTSSATNSLGSVYAGIAPVKSGSGYIIDVSGKRNTNHKFGEWNSIALKGNMSSDSSETVYFDAYINDYIYKRFESNPASKYFQNMLFGIDTKPAKAIDMYVDNLQVFMNGAQLIADKITPEAIGATADGYVMGNLELNSELDGADIQYFFSEDGIIAEDGTVTHSSSEQNVTLYVVVSKDGYKGFGEIPLSIVAYDDVTDSFFNIDIASMINSGESVDAIVSDFTLMDTLDDMYPLMWESSDEDAIKIDDSFNASVIRNTDDVPVTLTVRMQKSGTELIKEFEVVVKRLNVNLDIDEITGGNSNAVTEDFTLPAFTGDGEPIQWESSDDKKLFIFDNTAYVFRGSEPKNVTISAIGEFDGAPAKLDYEVTISPIVVEDIILADEDFESVELGTLPDTKLKDGTDMWRLNSSVSASDPNQYNYVVNENSVLTSHFLDNANTSNKVLQAGKKGVDNTQAVVHLLLDSPMETVVNLEFDVYAEAPSHGHMWIQNNKGTTLGGDLLRFPMMTKSLYIGDLQKNFSENTWHNIKLSMDMSNYLYDCYLDGKLEVKDGEVKKNGNILSQICFGYGKGLSGYKLVDNIKIWVDVEKSVGAFTKSIDLGDLTQVTSDLKLPALTPCGDADIIWLSTDPTVINSAGRVIRPAANEPDANVTLYALVKANNIRTVREFDVVVKSEKSDEDAVAADFENLVLDTSLYVMKDLPLLKKGIYGSDIIWQSSHPDIIDPETGKLNAKQFDNMQITSVTLTAVVKKGDVISEEKSFVFSVPERNYALGSSVDGSSDRIATPFGNVKDNNPATSWSPSDADEDKYIILTLPNATTTSTKINRINVVGTFAGVNVYVSNSTSGEVFTKIGASESISLSSAVEAKRVKFEFSGDSIDVSDIGIYYIADDNLLAREDAESVSLGNTSNITGDITLPAVGKINGSTITWESDKPEILADNGKLLSRPDERTAVKLTMTVKYGEDGIFQKSFNVYVAAKSSSSGGSGGSGGGSGKGSFGGGGSSASYISQTDGSANSQVSYFNDISGYVWAKEYIDSFAENGILSIPASGNFEPGRAITRAEFLKILMLAFNISGNASSDISFADVSPDNWYYDIVKRGVSCGIINGISETEFAPDANITRQDIAVMVKRAIDYCNIGIEENRNVDFTDSDKISHYAYDAVMSLCRAGIINGYEDGSFIPGGMANRAEAVVLIGRATK